MDRIHLGPSFCHWKEYNYVPLPVNGESTIRSLFLSMELHLFLYKRCGPLSPEGISPVKWKDYGEVPRLSVNGPSPVLLQEHNKAPSLLKEYHLWKGKSAMRPLFLLREPHLSKD